MKAIVLTYDKNAILTEHMISCYSKLWPDHPFTFLIPYQNPERCIPNTKRQYILTPPDLKFTVLTLLQDLDDEEWDYWCIDDKYPIHFEVNRITCIYESITNQDVRGISGILYCRARRMLNPNYLTGNSIFIGKERLLERKAYQQIWIHQFVQVKVLRYMFERFPDKIIQACVMDNLKDRLIKPSTHALFVTETNCAVFGESTSSGVITANCQKSLSEKGFKTPEWQTTLPATAVIIGTI